MLRVFKYCTFVVIATFIVLSFLPATSSQEKTIIIPRGSTYDTANILSEQGIINNKYMFWALAQASKYLNNSIKAGEYSFSAHPSLFSVVKKMISGDVVIRRITFPEGLTNEQILNIIKAEPNLKGEITRNYPEGTLLPETYLFTYGDTKQAMLDKVYESMNKSVSALWYKRDMGIDSVIKNTEDLINLASIVEREAKLHDDRDRIASVFLNRLKLNMKLQADPTTIYAITLGKYTLDRSLRYKDLEIKSPFNTYYAYGLPPTAIANPGLKSIKSVLNPITTDYIYFVVKDCQGGHAFSSNVKDHEKNVQAFRKLKCN